MEVKFNNVEYIVSESKIIDDVTIKLKKGQINTILGPTGAGKTTLVQMMNALIYPTKGNIKIGEITISDKETTLDIKKLRFNVGLVFQFSEDQFFCETVKKEIAYGLEFFHYKKEKLDKRIIDSLKMVGLPASYLNRDPFSLSSGEKRRVAIACVLALNPEIIVLDEPTIGLDTSGKKEFNKDIKDNKKALQ